MLVMRNFGYLGLHSVVHSKSSLARDRLVDFTREVQLRRREQGDKHYQAVPERGADCSNSNVVPEWHRDFVAEPTFGGGRFKEEALQGIERDVSTKSSTSPLYAQELAPVRLRPAPMSRSSTTSLKTQRGRGNHISGEDVEPYFHTTFCNELLCYPRLLHNCPKGNILIKVEMREVEWVSKYDSFVAYLPKGGPAVHNPRRGPYLVQEAYSSCSARCLDPHFLDEFKLKLPLILNGSKDASKPSRRLSVFFTVYRLSFSSRKKWGMRFRSKKSARKVDEIADEIEGESTRAATANGVCHLMQLSCGYLPLISNSALVEDGSHDVKMTQIARRPNKDLVQKGEMDGSTLILCEITGINEGGKTESDDFLGEDGESVGSSYYAADTASATSASESLAVSEITEGSRTKGKLKVLADPICLQVRVAVHSSIHCQNSILNEFLGQEPYASAQEVDNQNPLSKMLGLSREEMNQQSSAYSSPPPDLDSHHDNEKLLISAVDVSKASMCPVPDVFEHLHRVVRQLWKVVVLGTAEPNLLWANPAAPTPLRLQAFATLLQILGSSTLYSSKRGLSQLDGSTKWNLLVVSRVLALTFDEGCLFGELAHETLGKELLIAAKTSSTGIPENASDQKVFRETRRRHVRSNFEFLNNVAAAGEPREGPVGVGAEATDSVVGGLGALAVSSSSGLVNPNGSAPLPMGTLDKVLQLASEVQPSDEPIKVDSVTDFRSALKAGFEEVDDDGPFYDGSSTGSNAALALVKAYSGPQAMSRRWMTAPSPGLATIREDGDDEGDSNANALLELPQTRKARGPLDSLDTELYINPAKSTVKQMRVPNLRKKTDSQDTNTVQAESPEAPAESQVFDSDSNQEPPAM